MSDSDAAPLTTAMVVFPGESHDLSRIGKPSHRIERLRYIVGWFDKYVEGRRAPLLDAP